MRITFIFGNGFDIQCGLDTRYSDFLKEYTIPKRNDSSNIRNFKRYLLESENQELWSNAELAMGIYLGDFSDSNLNDYLERIADFQYKMIYHLEKQQNRCSWKKTDDIERVFKAFIFHSFKDVIPQNDKGFDIENVPEDNLYHFITFNYTNILDKIISLSLPSSSNTARHRTIGKYVYDDTFQPIHHVHGELASHIIMGVNDESQLITNPTLTLTKALKRVLIKPDMNYGINHNWDASAMSAIQNSDIIAIYGVSYGQTDNLWWDAIRQWLEARERHKLVSFERDLVEGPTLRLAWEKVASNVKKREGVLKKLGYIKDHPMYEQLLNQVYIILNTNLLDIGPILLGDSFDEIVTNKTDKVLI